MTETGSGAGGSTTSTMERASEAADTAKQEAGQVADRAKQEAGAVVDEAKAQSQQLAHEAKDQLRRQIDESTHKMADSLRSVGQELDTMAGSAQDGSGLPATVVREIGARADSLAERVDQGGVQALASDLRRFASRRPGVFLAGALFAGVAVGRLARNIDFGEVKDAITGDDPGSSEQVMAPNGVSSSAAPIASPAPDAYAVAP